MATLTPLIPLDTQKIMDGMSTDELEDILYDLELSDRVGVYSFFRRSEGADCYMMHMTLAILWVKTELEKRDVRAWG